MSNEQASGQPAESTIKKGTTSTTSCGEANAAFGTRTPLTEGVIINKSYGHDRYSSLEGGHVERQVAPPPSQNSLEGKSQNSNSGNSKKTEN